MRYELQFVAPALKEWHRLGATLKARFKKKLADRLDQPHVPGDRLRDATSRYKIKLRASGHRLVYEVLDDLLIVEVIALGKRDRGAVHGQAANRTS